MASLERRAARSQDGLNCTELKPKDSWRSAWPVKTSTTLLEPSGSKMIKRDYEI